MTAEDDRSVVCRLDYDVYGQESKPEASPTPPRLDLQISVIIPV